MFYFLDGFHVANYADDTTPFSAGKDNDSVIENLKQSSSILFKWLKENYMKINTEKSHLLMSGNLKISSNIDGNLIESDHEQELLGITIDSKLTFKSHVNNVCKKASQKLNALVKVSSYMDTNKRKILMKSFITSQFGYCPLIWMFHSRQLNGRINRLHERALRITYNDENSSFEKLLEKDNSVSIHQRNLQVLAIEMLKLYRQISPDFLNEIFIRKTTSYNLREKYVFGRIYHGTESIVYLRPKIWDLVPVELKEMQNLENFRNKVRKWKCIECPC